MRRGYEPVRQHANQRHPGARASASISRWEAPGAVQLAPEVGRFFQDVRKIFRLSREQVARNLATRADIIAALEAGDVSALPPWPETCRIVRMYAGSARLDPRPVLHSLETLIEQNRQGAAAQSQSLIARLRQRIALVLAVLNRTPSRTISAGPVVRNWVTRRRSGLALFAVALPIALVVMLTQTTVLDAAVSRLPAPVARMVRGAQDFVTLQLAPVRDGLRWIEVDDPRTRRGDKWQTAGQPD